MANFYNTLLEVLKSDERFFTEDGTLLRNKVYESALNMDVGLIGLLLSNTETKQRFFTEVSGTFVFDKVGFGWVVNNRQFLPDSYTRYKNRIGLTDGRGDLVSQSNDVVLSFPYKDCVLEGGQTKDDQKRDEMFYNTTLAPDEVDKLLYPKVLVGARRYSERGVEESLTFGDSDNLIIKGNNLLAISSLLKRYEGRVKCIYIDPPYNRNEDKGNFYNDTFNHSSWLTFMKNRLELLWRFLEKEGSIWISIGDDEAAYLKVLADELFGKENFIAQIVWQKRYSRENREAIGDVHEYIIVYAKNPAVFKEARNLVPMNEDQAKVYKNPNNDPRGRWRPVPLTAQAGHATPEQFYEIVAPGGKVHRPSAGRCWGISKRTFEQYLAEGRIYFGKDNNSQPNLIRYLSEVEGVAPWTWWPRDEVGDTDISKKEILALFDGQAVFDTPKPELLLERVFHIATNPGDLVMDCFLGSGTSVAVAHKMGRNYIGVEQMDYVEDLVVRRLEKVIDGDPGGISESLDWQGGGSFVYCELMKCNQVFVDKVAKAETDIDLAALLERILSTGFISSKVNPTEITGLADEFDKLLLEDKKRFILELLDKNMLYVNLSDLDDEEYAISDADKSFTRSFYELEDN